MSTASDESAKVSSKTSALSEFLAFLKTVSVLIVIALFLRASVVEAFKIPSGSMIPTLKIGDHILVSKLSYGIHLPFISGFIYQYGTPKRGDIVVFTKPDDPRTTEDESDTNIIKRVVGLPGERLEVRGAQVYVNGVALTEPYARWDEGGIYAGNFDAETVPPDSIFLLGDNRDHSKDSRFWSNPFLEINRVKGRALIIYWSWDSFWRIGKVLR